MGKGSADSAGVLVRVLVLIAVTGVASLVSAYQAAASACGDGACAGYETPQNCYQDCPQHCHNGVKDEDEAGIDCGGSCALNTVLELCDGKDNNRDCLVDVNCRTNAGRAVSGGPVKPAGGEASCTDGIQNQDELAVDCGGACKTTTAEACDGIDNDKDCYADEGEICGAPIAKEQNEDLCTFPEAQIGLESQPTYLAVKSPSCIIEDRVGGLNYLSTLNLTKSLNAVRAQKETLQSTVAIYQGGKDGRCSAIFTAYPNAASAKKAAASTESQFMPLKKSDDSYAYINETEGVGYWLKGNYMVTVTNFDYPNNHKWEDDCTELLNAYLAKIGSDLNPASQTAADEQATKMGKTGQLPTECAKAGSNGSEAECRAGSAAIGKRQAPDENGMVTQCDYDSEAQKVRCKKVKASDLPKVVPDAESEPGVEVAEGATASGKASATGSAAAPEESQAEKIRRIAKQNSVYLSNYNDEKLLDALQKFGSRHKKELEERYGNQEPSDEKMAEILRQFSQEEFAKEPNAKQQASQQPKRQSIFSRVKNFFKRLV